MVSSTGPEILGKHDLNKFANPFYHRVNWTIDEYIKIFIFSFTLLPIRLLGMGVAFLFMYSTVLIAFWFGKDRSCGLKNEPATPLYGVVYRYLTQFLDVVNRVFLWICGFQQVIINGTPDPNAQILVCAPHSTFADSIVVMLPHLKSIVAKKAAKNIPFIGTLVSFLQPVWVERDESKSRRNAVEQIKKRVYFKSEDKQWPQICIFPEGTCTNRTGLIAFKKGAFYTGCPVQPVTIRYNNKFDTLTWTWDGPNTFLVLWWSLCQPSLHVQMDYLPLYVPNDKEKTDPELFAENVRTLMARHLGVPKLEYTYEDIKSRDKRHQVVEKFNKVQSIKEAPCYLRTFWNIFMKMENCASSLAKYLASQVCAKKNSESLTTIEEPKPVLTVSDLNLCLVKKFNSRPGSGASLGSPEINMTPGEGQFNCEILCKQLATLLSNGNRDANSVVNSQNGHPTSSFEVTAGESDLHDNAISLSKLLNVLHLVRARYIDNKPLSEESENRFLQNGGVDSKLFNQIFKPKIDSEFDAKTYVQLYNCLLGFLYSTAVDKCLIKDCQHNIEEITKKSQ